MDRAIRFSRLLKNTPPFRAASFLLAAQLSAPF